jgi:hypothetical protein
LTEKWEYGGDNLVLRFVLYGLYGQRCYRCQEPKNFVDIEIDHIVPTNTNDDEFVRIRRKHGLGEEFGRHDPGNLAPICSPCNKLKSGRAFNGSPHESDLLLRAGDRRHKVIAEVEKFVSADSLAKALVKATVSDLSDAKTKETLVMYAPALVQKIASVDEGLVRIIKVSHQEAIPGGNVVQLRFALSQDHRVLVDVLENTFGVSLRDAMANNVGQLVGQIKSELDTYVLEELQKQDPYFPEDPGPAHVAHLGLEVNAVTLDRSDEGLVMSVNAGLEIQQLRSIPYQQDDGLWGQRGDAYGYVRLRRQLVQSSFRSNDSCHLLDYEVVSRDFHISEYV